MKLIFKLNQLLSMRCRRTCALNNEVRCQLKCEWMTTCEKIAQNIQQELTSGNLRHYRNMTLRLTWAFTCSVEISSRALSLGCVLLTSKAITCYLKNQSVPWYARFADMAWNCNHCHYIAGYSSLPSVRHCNNLELIYPWFVSQIRSPPEAIACGLDVRVSRPQLAQLHPGNEV